MTLMFKYRGMAETVADRLKAFAQPQRSMILSLLFARGELSVRAINFSIGIIQPAFSQQHGELRWVGLISTRRQSKQVYYGLFNETLAR